MCTAPRDDSRHRPGRGDGAGRFLIGPLSSTSTTGLADLPGMVELLEMRHEVAAKAINEKLTVITVLIRLLRNRRACGADGVGAHDPALFGTACTSPADRAMLAHRSATDEFLLAKAKYDHWQKILLPI